MRYPGVEISATVEGYGNGRVLGLRALRAGWPKGGQKHPYPASFVDVLGAALPLQIIRNGQELFQGGFTVGGDQLGGG